MEALMKWTLLAAGSTVMAAAALATSVNTYRGDANIRIDALIFIPLAVIAGVVAAIAVGLRLLAQARQGRLARGLALAGAIATTLVTAVTILALVASGVVGGVLGEVPVAVSIWAALAAVLAAVAHVKMLREASRPTATHA